MEFLSWFLSTLHSCLGGTKKSRETVISRTFRGRMRIYSRKVPPIDMVETKCSRKLIICINLPKLQPLSVKLLNLENWSVFNRYMECGLFFDSYCGVVTVLYLFVFVGRKKTRKTNFLQLMSTKVC